MFIGSELYKRELDKREFTSLHQTNLLPHSPTLSLTVCLLEQNRTDQGAASHRPHQQHQHQCGVFMARMSSHLILISVLGKGPRK